MHTHLNALATLLGLASAMAVDVSRSGWRSSSVRVSASVTDPIPCGHCSTSIAAGDESGPAIDNWYRRIQGWGVEFAGSTPGGDQYNLWHLGSTKSDDLYGIIGWAACDTMMTITNPTYATGSGDCEKSTTSSPCLGKTTNGCTLTFSAVFQVINTHTAFTNTMAIRGTGSAGSSKIFPVEGGVGLVLTVASMSQCDSIITAPNDNGKIDVNKGWNRWFSPWEDLYHIEFACGSCPD